MIAVLQRTSRASVKVDDKTIGEIKKRGFLISPPPPSFKVSELRSFKVSKFQNFEVSKF